jgi:hypothetical protein
MRTLIAASIKDWKSALAVVLTDLVDLVGLVIKNLIRES